MGLDIYLNAVGFENAPKSETNPDHICNKGYLRSSYNDGGFNSVVNRLIGEDFYTIFGYTESLDDEEGNWHPSEEDLRAIAVRARSVAARLRAVEQPLRAVSVAPNPYMALPKHEAEDAIRLVTEELGRPGHFRNYSSATGNFYLDGLEIVAAIPGVQFGRPCVHLVYRMDKEDLEWYAQVADIAAEFAEYALTLPEGERSIRWSA